MRRAELEVLARDLGIKNPGGYLVRELRAVCKARQELSFGRRRALGEKG